MKKNKACLAAIVVSTTIATLSISQQSSYAYWVKDGGSEFNLNAEEDKGTTLVPITSAEDKYAFSITLTYGEKGNLTALVTNNTQGSRRKRKLKLTGLTFNNNGQSKVFSFGNGVSRSKQKDFSYDGSLNVDNDGKINFKDVQAVWSFKRGRKWKTDKSETVPEPLTVFGTMLAGAFGVRFKQRRQKLSEQKA